MKLLILLLFTSAVWASDPSPGPAFPPISQTVGTLEQAPTATVQRGATQRTVIEHGPIYLGEHVVTGPGQTVTVRLPDQSELTVAPSSDMAVTQFSQQPGANSAQVTVDRGMVHADVAKDTYTAKKPFIIRTKTAVMGVRGTEFIIEQTANGPTSLHTLEGAVAIGKTSEDLSNPRASAIVDAGKTSSMSLNAARPNPPTRFNRKTLYNYLGKRAPGVVKQIERRQEIKRSAQHSTGSGIHQARSKREKRQHWKRPKTRRQIGH